MPAPNRIELRKFIVEGFSRDDLRILCSDYFADFHRDHDGRDAVLTSVAEDLLAYCERRDQLERLRYALHATRRKVYEDAFGPFIAAEIVVKPRNPQQLFLSYAHQDDALARALAAELRSAGATVWIASDGIQPGEKWAEAIDRGMLESGVFVVLLTPRSLASKWVKHEIYLAVQTHFRDEMQVLPLKLAAYDERAVPPSLGAFQLINLEQDYGQGVRALYRQLGLRRVVALPADLQSAIASSLAAVRKAAVEELAALLHNRDEDLVACARQVLEKLSADDSRSVSSAALAALKPPLITPPSNPDRWRISTPFVMEFSRIPAGEFLMGSAETDKEAFGNEKPQHRLFLPEYYMAKTPVTVAQFEVFVKDSGYKTSAEIGTGGWKGGWIWDGKQWVQNQEAYWRKPLGKESDISKKAQHPVTQVSYYDGVAFCEWLSQQTGQRIRLPSEAEWEKAARGSEGRLYAWGNQAIDNTRCNYNGAVGDTTAVGQYSPLGDTPLTGLQDMTGNVWEWTRSRFGDWRNSKAELKYAYPYNASDGREDLGKLDNNIDLIVYRGGGWRNAQNVLRCANRNYDFPVDRYYLVGFRVVRGVAPVS